MEKIRTLPIGRSLRPRRAASEQKVDYVKLNQEMENEKAKLSSVQKPENDLQQDKAEKNADEGSPPAAKKLRQE